MMPANTLAPERLNRMSSCWRIANYLSASQSYLYDNPLLKNR
jgi:phosphoketolase